MALIVTSSRDFETPGPALMQAPHDGSRKVGATFLEPSCGACINAGPGVSKSRDEVTISAINRNFPGRSGPGRLDLANPFTVAASPIAGYITTWEPGKVLTET